jgi:5-methylcytosine-specific restriction endonuclease McrA
MSPARPKLTAKQRAEIFRDNEGRCHICTRKIAPGESWDAEHPLARGLGGSDKPKDLRPAHVDCHKPKTREDRRIMAKADRSLKRYIGVKRTRNPLPGSRTSGLKKKMDGTVERRK